MPLSNVITLWNYWWWLNSAMMIHMPDPCMCERCYLTWCDNSVDTKSHINISTINTMYSMSAEDFFSLLPFFWDVIMGWGVKHLSHHEHIMKTIAEESCWCVVEIEAPFLTVIWALACGPVTSTVHAKCIKNISQPATSWGREGPTSFFFFYQGKDEIIA